ncbi:DinB family protein [Alkalihalobacillus sp. TS-13]|uniref:DinB family protein n=1 Tax=Alkalihalobacillus sp. TS-13 TaxID=2842455 RepID=UPI001C880A76|nr:DinB family protein [Alkalihalobacillus sp. TS-13]
MSNELFSTAKSVREMVIQQVILIPEEMFDVQPDQFNNTIRWNVGHIAFSNEYLLSLGVPLKSTLPDHFTPLFNTGTKPSEWSQKPPTKEELIHYLTEQLSSLPQIPPNIFDQQMDPPVELGPLKFKTFGEVFNFATVHETIHLTTISCLLRVLQYQKV